MLIQYIFIINEKKIRSEVGKVCMFYIVIIDMCRNRSKIETEKKNIGKLI